MNRDHSEVAEQAMGVKAKPNILIIDDDVEYGKALVRALSDDFSRIWHVTSFDEAVAEVEGREDFFDVIILDHNLGEQNTGLDYLRNLKGRDVVAEVIVLTGVGSRALGVEMLKAGAFRYFTKQSQNDEEVICAIEVAGDVAAMKRSERRWTTTGRSLKKNMTMISFSSALAVILVGILNFVPEANFWKSSIVIIVLILVSVLAFSGIRRLRVVLKSEQGSFEIQADSD